MRIEIEEIKRVAEEIVEIAEGSGDPFAEKIVDQIEYYVECRKFVADEVIDLISHVAVTVRALNKWRVANGMKAL